MASQSPWRFNKLCKRAFHSDLQPWQGMVDTFQDEKEWGALKMMDPGFEKWTQHLFGETSLRTKQLLREKKIILLPRSSTGSPK